MSRKNLSLLAAIALVIGLSAAGKAQTVYNYNAAPYVFTYGSSWKGFFYITQGLITVNGVPKNLFNYSSPAGGVVNGVIDQFSFTYSSTGNITGVHVVGHGTRRDVYMRYSSVTLTADIKRYAATTGTPSIVVRNLSGTTVMSTVGYIFPGSFITYVKDLPH